MILKMFPALIFHQLGLLFSGNRNRWKTQTIEEKAQEPALEGMKVADVL